MRRNWRRCRAAASSDTLAMATNYLEHGIYILHGDADDNVPVREARRMVEALGGPGGFMENAASHLRLAPVTREVAPERPGIVQSVDSRAVGIAKEQGA